MCAAVAAGCVCYVIILCKFVSYLSCLPICVISFVSACRRALTDITDAWILYCRPSRFLLLFLDIISTLMAVYVISPEKVCALQPRGKPPPCSTQLRATLTSFDLWSPTGFIYTSSGWRLSTRRRCRAGRRVQRQRATSPALCLHPSVSVSTSTAASNCVTFALLNVRTS